MLPTHIHDSDRAARTAKLAAAVDQHGDKSPGIYDTLLKNSRAVAAEQDKVLAGLAGNRNDAVLQMLPFQTGAGLAATSKKVCDSLEETHKQLIDAIAAYSGEKAGAEHEAATAAAAIKAAQAKVAVAKQNVTNWNATIAVLEAAAAELPAAGASIANSKGAGLDELQKQLQAAGDKEVEYADSEGVTHKQKIADILRNQIDAKADGNPVLKIPDAPGATLAILNLGVDLATIEKERAEAKLAELSRRLQLYERVEAERRLASALLANSGCNCQQSPATLIIPADRSFVVQASLLAAEGSAAQHAVAEAAKSISGETEQQREQRVVPQIQDANKQTVALASDLIKLRQLAVAESIATRVSLDLKMSSARLAHEESIEDSKVNDAAWRAVIRSGAVVLNQYEQGGFTAQDAADIVSIAQAIAVGVIAGRM